MHEKLKIYCEKLLSEGISAELLAEIRLSLDLNSEFNEWQIIDELLYRLNMSTFENTLMSNKVNTSK